MATIFANYELLETLADHADGTLHKAQDRDSNALVLLQRPSGRVSIEEGRRRLLRESGVLAQLATVPGVARVQGLCSGSGDGLVLKYFAGRTLAEVIRSHRPTVEQCLTWGLKLAETLDAVHKAGFLHRNLSVCTVLAADDELALFDFALATPISEDRHPDREPDPVRDWTALAPEQTGRISRALDRRTDYYALGMVLYTLVSGAPAFEIRNPLEAVHAHLAKVPPPPRDCPEALAAIILKLAAKSPDQRYQSATGLIADLLKCRDRLAAGRTEPFSLGSEDQSDRLQVSRRLFGREAEVERLREAYDRTLQGSRESLLLAGPSGVGKSALARETGAWVVAEQGFFLTGKYDSEREVAYAAVIQMIEDLTQQILRGPEAAAWKRTFAEVLGDNQAVITALSPAFAELSGPQPAPALLSARETENRFLFTMETFLSALRVPGRSLVLFFDDLQWIDPASIRLIEYLEAQKDNGPTLTLYSYRTESVTSPDAQTFLERLQKSTTVVTLGALSEDQVASWVADTLGTSVRDPEAFAQALLLKTGGSPLFLTQLVRTLHREGLLWYNRTDRRWDWKAAELAALPASENVSDLLIAQFQTLPPAAVALLGIGACLGTTVRSSDLEAFPDALPDLAAALWPLIDQQYFLPLSDGYLALASPETRAGTVEAPVFSLRFQHDRIRQAAYEQLDAGTRAAIHLKAARFLAAKRPAEAVGHYLAVRDRITDQAERELLARLLVEVGEQSRASSATRQALDFFRQAKTFADEGLISESQRRRLLLLLAETAFVCHEIDEAEATDAALLARLEDPVDRAEVHMMEMDSYTFLGRMDEALGRGTKALALLGLKLAVKPSPTSIATTLIKVLVKASARNPERLFHRLGDVPSKVRLSLRLLSKFLVPAQMSGNVNLFVLSTLMTADLALDFGNSDETSGAFGNFAILLSVLGRHRQAFEFASLAMRLEQARPNPKTAAMVHSAYSFFTLPWNRPWSEVPPAALRGAEAARRAGDQFFMAYQPLFAAVFSTPATLEESIAQLREAIRTIEATRQDDAAIGATFALQRLRALRGDRTDPVDFSDPGFDELAAFQSWEAKKNASGLAVYHLYKAQVLFHFDRFGEAWAQWQLGKPHAPTILGSAYMEEYAVYGAVLAAEGSTTPGRRREALAILRKEHGRVRRWAATCPENFAALEAMIAGELAGAAGRPKAAAQAWSRALTLAASILNPRWKALIHERAARFHLGRGDRRLGGYLMADAYRLYALWGAGAKLQVLEKAYPELTLSPGTTEVAQSIDGDAASLWKVSQVIAREMDVDRLLGVVVQAVIENAGARRGWLLLLGEEGWEVVVRGDAEGPALTFANRVSPESEGIPLSILGAAPNNDQGLLVASAWGDPLYSSDPLVTARGVKSVLVLGFSPPGSTLKALWYLENDLVEGAFSADRLAGLRLLSGQIGISLENARMYRTLSDLNRDLESKVQSRTAELEERNRQFLHSVEYAGVLQRSLLPRAWSSVADQFALWGPKDIVGGDLYWFRESAESCLLAVVDCTGHGVPGALITMLVHSILDEAWASSVPGDLAALLAKAHGQFRRTLGQDKNGESNDGFDVGLLWWSPVGGPLRYAGARLSLLHSADGTMTWVHGGRKGLGYRETREPLDTVVHTIPRVSGARYYLSSDGYLGQVGGEKDISFGRDRFAALLARTAGLPMAEQARQLQQTFDGYRGSRPQADDITVVGVQF